MRPLLIASLCWLAGCGSGAATKARAPDASAGQQPKELSPDARLERGLTRLGHSRYAEAEADLLAAFDGSKRQRALLALSELYWTTGRYDEALRRAKEAATDRGRSRER